jgi:hypothetical protein
VQQGAGQLLVCEALRGRKGRVIQAAGGASCSASKDSSVYQPYIATPLPQSCLSLSILPMGNSYWSKACAAQVARTPLHLQQANYGGSIFAVSEAYAVMCCCLHARRRLLCGLTRDAG